jgi:hypothetical protein
MKSGDIMRTGSVKALAIALVAGVVLATTGASAIAQDAPPPAAQVDAAAEVQAILAMPAGPARKAAIAAAIVKNPALAAMFVAAATGADQSMIADIAGGLKSAQTTLAAINPEAADAVAVAVATGSTDMQSAYFSEAGGTNVAANSSSGGLPGSGSNGSPGSGSTSTAAP